MVEGEGMALGNVDGVMMPSEVGKVNGVVTLSEMGKVDLVGTTALEQQLSLVGMVLGLMVAVQQGCCLDVVHCIPEKFDPLRCGDASNAICSPWTLVTCTLA